MSESESESEEFNAEASARALWTRLLDARIGVVAIGVRAVPNANPALVVYVLKGARLRPGDIPNTFRGYAVEVSRTSRILPATT